jgi:hypothetical protein
VSLHISSKHLILEPSDRLLERLTLSFKPPIAIDFCLKGTVTKFPEGFVDTIVPHVVSVKKPQDVGSDRRWGNVHIVADDSSLRQAIDVETKRNAGSSRQKIQA